MPEFKVKNPLDGELIYNDVAEFIKDGITYYPGYPIDSSDRVVTSRLDALIQSYVRLVKLLHEKEVLTSEEVISLSPDSY